jgi:hypothetical protein
MLSVPTKAKVDVYKKTLRSAVGAASENMPVGTGECSVIAGAGD